MIDELRYHNPAKQQIVTREVTMAAADEMESLQRRISAAEEAHRLLTSKLEWAEKAFAAARATAHEYEDRLNVLASESERLRNALTAIYNARNAGDWVTEPLQWAAETARRALEGENGVGITKSHPSREGTTP